MEKEIKKISDLKFDGNGLIPVIIQDASNNQILMLAHMNMESLKLTLKKGFLSYVPPPTIKQLSYMLHLRWACGNRKFYIVKIFMKWITSPAVGAIVGHSQELKGGESGIVFVRDLWANCAHGKRQKRRKCCDSAMNMMPQCRKNAQRKDR